MVQGRNLRRFEKALWRQRVLEESAATAQREAHERRTEASLLRQHTAAVLGAVWRTIHEEPMERWPGIMGRLYTEHFKGVLHGESDRDQAPPSKVDSSAHLFAALVRPCQAKVLMCKGRGGLGNVPGVRGWAGCVM